MKKKNKMKMITSSSAKHSSNDSSFERMGKGLWVKKLFRWDKTTKEPSENSRNFLLGTSRKFFGAVDSENWNCFVKNLE